MKGVIYIWQSPKVAIEECSFSLNDAGPIFNSQQLIGFFNNDNESGNVQRASVIFIDSGIEDISITGNKFWNNALSFMRDHIMNTNIDLYNFFPPSYYLGSSAPGINIHMQENTQKSPEQISKKISIDISFNEFKD